MFEELEALDFIKTFLQIENPEDLLKKDKRRLLDEIIYNIQTRMPFQNVSLQSVPVKERKRLTAAELKSNFVSGLGGLCFDMNINTFHLLTAIGYDVIMVRSTVSSSIRFPNNHVALIVRDVERKGDQFLADVALGHPTFQAISLDFEKESPVFYNCYLEYKYIKHEGKLLRMQRKGDSFVSRGKQENSDLEFWLDDWRRFYTADLEGTKDPSEFDDFNKAVYTNPKATPFHLSHRVVTFTDGKAAIVMNDKCLIQSEKGELVTTLITGGDEGIIAAIRKICPVIPEEMLHKSLRHWREINAAADK